MQCGGTVLVGGVHVCLQTTPNLVGVVISLSSACELHGMLSGHMAVYRWATLGLVDHSMYKSSSCYYYLQINVIQPAVIANKSPPSL